MLAFGATATLFAAPAYDPAIFSSLTWRSIGPPRGGRSIASAGSPSRPLEYYFGATGGGLWKTTDGGLTWRPVTDGQFHSSSVGAVAVSESNPDVVYIGMGETELRGNIMQGDGVYKSTDAGKTWKHIGLDDTQAISRIRIHPDQSRHRLRLRARAIPTARTPSAASSAPKTAAQTWKKVLFRNDHAGAVDLCLDPNNPQRAFRRHLGRLPHAVEPVQRRPRQRPLQIHRRRATTGPRSRAIPACRRASSARSASAVSGADSNRVYAMVENENGGVFVSDDAGATWKLISEDRSLRQRAFYYSRIYADPKAKDTSTCSTPASTNPPTAARPFAPLRTPHGDNHDLWIDPTNPAAHGRQQRRRRQRLA